MSKINNLWINKLFLNEIMNKENMSDRLHKIRINEATNQITNLSTTVKKLTNQWINEQIIQWIDESIIKNQLSN